MSTSREFVPFENRWEIIGTLTTVTWLHVGSGETAPRSRLLLNNRGAANRNAEDPLIKLVIKDHAENPCIPGTSLKGILRSAASSVLEDAPIQRLFGCPATEDNGNSGCGGHLTFFSAEFIRPGNPAVTPPFWNPRKGTGIIENVAIDRRTGTAATGKLYFAEAIAPGAEFRLRFTGQNLAERDVALLLLLLNEFNHLGTPIRLGADASNSWGRCQFKLESVRRFERKDLAAWIKDPGGKTGWRVVEKLPVDPQLVRRIPNLAKPASPGATSQKLVLRLALDFEGPFLVRQGGEREQPDDEIGIPAETRLTPDNHVVLDAKAARGVFRSRAEAILRTVSRRPELVAPDPSRVNPECFAGTEQGSPIDELSVQLQSLSVAGRVFGAGGWKSVIGFSDFVSTYPALRIEKRGPGVPSKADALRRRIVPLEVQEFVAIDRFTGGAAHDIDAKGKVHGKKFSVRAAWYPILCGEITLDLDRCRIIGAEDWAAGLLALVIRDMRHADLPFGANSKRGYGRCITTFDHWDHENRLLRRDAASEQWWTETAGKAVAHFHDFIDALNRSDS